MYRFKLWSRVVCCAGAGLAWAATSQAAQVLFGIDQADQLITINMSTGAGTLVGALSTSMSAIGLAQTGGKLYAFDTNGGNVLRQLDPTNASTLATIAVGYTSLDTLAEGDLAFNNSGTGFLASSLMADGSFGGGSFFSLNLAGNSHNLVADNTAQQFSGLAFNPLNSALFGLTLDGTQLYTINPATGAATLVGGTGIATPRCCLGGLSFRSDGVLFADLGDSDPLGNSTLYTLDTSTGTATSIGDIGFAGVSGIAFRDNGVTPPPPATPEPSTGLLMLALPLLAAGGKKIRAWRVNHE